MLGLTPLMILDECYPLLRENQFYTTETHKEERQIKDSLSIFSLNTEIRRLIYSHLLDACHSDEFTIRECQKNDSCPQELTSQLKARN